MPYTVDLAFQVEEALLALSADGHQEGMELIAAALADPKSWPTPGGLDWALRSGPRLWIMFTAYLGGIWVVSLGDVNDGVMQTARAKLQCAPLSLPHYRCSVE